MGEGKHARFTVSSGGARASAVSFGCDGRVPGARRRGRSTRASGWSATSGTGQSSRAWCLRHASACAPAPIIVLGEPDDYLTAVVTELDTEFLDIDADQVVVIRGDQQRAAA